MCPQTASTPIKRNIDNVERVEDESSWHDDIDSDKSQNSRKTQVDFVVVQNDMACLIGSSTVQEMDLLTVHADQFVAEVKGSPQNKRADGRKTDDESRPSTQKTVGGQGKCAPTKVEVRGASICHAASNDLGSLGTATLTTDNNVRARVLPNRKRPISLEKPVKQELDTLVRRRSRSVLLYPSMSQHIGSVRWQSCTNRMESCGCALTPNH